MVDLDPRAYLPGLNFSDPLILGIILWFVAILLISGVGVFIVIWYYKNKTYFIKINIFEKINGVWQATRKDRARETRLSNDGTVIHYWRKQKAFRPMPSIQSGVNTYYYFIRSDGHYINFGMGDLDEQMRELGAKFQEKDVRYHNVGLRKSLKDKYDTPTFMQKYGGLITYVVLILITMIMVILLFDKFIEISGRVGEILDKAPVILDKYDQLLVSINNACGGSGIVPAG